MTDRDDDDDLEAAEYVLGTLDPAARAAAAARRAQDGAFAALLEAWERRLIPLSESARDVAPPPEMWAAILRRLGLDDGRPSEPVSGATILLLNRSVRRWRGATAFTTAVAACLALVVASGAWRQLHDPDVPYIALLQKTDAQPAYVVRASLGDRTLAVRSLAAQAPPGRSYELWVIDPQLGAPKSLGVLDPSTSVHPLPKDSTPDVLARATYAVTEEQAGGSPTGAPTSAPIYVGHLVSGAF